MTYTTETAVFRTFCSEKSEILCKRVQCYE